MAGGRPLGSRNLLTRNAKEAIESAFEAIGGVEKLTEWAKAHPEDFYPIWAKLLPKHIDVTARDERALSVEERKTALLTLLTSGAEKVG